MQSTRRFFPICGLISALLLNAVAPVLSTAQSKKVIFLSDKNQSPFSLSDPQQYLSQRAIERRKRYSITIDSSDLPVNPAYIAQIAALNKLRIIGSSRWLNAVIIECNDAVSLAQLNTLPFVQSVQNIALRTSRTNNRKKEVETISDSRPMQSRMARSHTDLFDYGPASEQIKIHNGHILHNAGARGEGMMIAFFDAGYFQYNNNRFIDSAIQQGRITATKDFYNNDNNVSDDDAHGLYCLSAVSGYVPGEYAGSCPKASYLLLKTEDVSSEQVIEEYMWGLGAEYADSCGADVFSSSVGYTTFDDPAQNHNYNELDGNTVIVTRMADKAAGKGILVVTSAGNEGSSSWKYIGTPADGDSVFAVGAINVQKQIAGFSSFGPTPDGRIKPNAVSVGVSTALIGTNQSVIYANGTSFSTPNLAGLMTCFWQLFPELNNARLMELIQASSDRHQSPDPQYGYGIPDMAKAVAAILQKKSDITVQVTECNAEISWKSYDAIGMGYVIQRKFPDEDKYISLDTIYSKENTWELKNYFFSDKFISNDAMYRIIQLLDTNTVKPINFILDSASVSVPAFCKSNEITIFPNPAKNAFSIRFGMISGLNRVQILITNSSGQKIKTIELVKPPGFYTTPQIGVEGLSKGAYIVNISENHNRLSTEKLIIREASVFLYTFL